MPRATESSPVATDRGGLPLRWLLAARVGGLVAAAALRRSRRIAAVASDLRSSILYVPFTMNGLTRPIIQRITEAAPMPKPDGVRITTYRAAVESRRRGF